PFFSGMSPHHNAAPVRRTTISQRSRRPSAYNHRRRKMEGSDGMDGSGRQRTALVVIHGIGEQPPLATLGLFSQGLIDHLKLEKPRPGFRDKDGELLPVLHFSGTGTTGPLEVLEFSWQHLVRGRSSVVRTFVFLLEAILAPLHFRRHWRVLAAAGPAMPAPCVLVLGQLLVACLLLVPLLAAGALTAVGITWLAAFVGSLAPQPLQLGATGITLLTGGALLLLLAALQLSAVAGDALEAVHLRRRTDRLHGVRWSGLHGGTSRAWRLPAVLMSAVLVLGAVVLVAAARTEWLLLFNWLGEAANRRFLVGVPLLAGGLLLGAFIVGWVRDYAGDLAWYVTADRQPSALHSRHDIKTQAATLIASLLRDPDIGGVVVAGHSLGSVIVLVALNVLSRWQRAGADLPLGKLRGLVTFGSPLD